MRIQFFFFYNYGIRRTNIWREKKRVLFKGHNRQEEKLTKIKSIGKNIKRVVREMAVRDRRARGGRLGIIEPESKQTNSVRSKQENSSTKQEGSLEYMINTESVPYTCK